VHKLAGSFHSPNWPLHQRARLEVFMRFANPVVALVCRAVLILALAPAVPIALAQDDPPQAQPAQQLAPAQLDQMLAPIALYPDALLGQVLIAATYPLEVVEAQRWLQDPGNAALQGDALGQALQQQPWDPSVKSLVPFSQVLQMMDANLSWTEQLGDTFLAQQAAVMDSVQRLRAAARAAGTLQSTPQQVVSQDDQAIDIAPANPEVVYVPVYDPAAIYGAWPYPDDPPDYFPYTGVEVGVGIGFGLGIGIFAPYWGWDRWDWHRHHLDIDGGRFNPINGGRPPIGSRPWQHDPDHRHGVPYRDAPTQARFQGGAEPSRREYRGYAAAPFAAAPQRQAQPAFRENYGNPVTREAPHFQPAPPANFERPSPPAFESYGRQPEVRAQEQRGVSSMQSRPAPSMHSSPSGGGSRRGR
jgi:hypothetical protein